MNQLKNTGYLICAALILMTDAFYNGFPIVYSDTSTYIASGFAFETPGDRPITYGVFLWLFSLNGFSIWLPVFLQSLILVTLIRELMKQILRGKFNPNYFLLVISFLALFTGLSWTVSQLMPDIFTPIALFAAILILIGKYPLRSEILLYFIFFLATSTHLSHLLLFGSFLVLLFLFRKKMRLNVFSINPAKKIGILLALVLSTILISGAALSKSKHIFLMGAMVEHGILKEYLNDHCGEKEYKLCQYKDSLPEFAWQFIWDENGPFQKVGGWKNTKAEFSEIITGTLTEPKFIIIHIRESFKATIQQLSSFGIGDGNGVFLAGTKLHERMALRFPNDIQAYENSRQSNGEFFELKFINSIYSAIVILAVLIIVYFWSSLRKNKESPLYLVAVLFLLGILLNAWSSGTFANAISRLGCKMIWILPFLSLLSWLYSRKKQTTH